MAIHYRRIADYLRTALSGRGLDELARLRPRHDPSPARVPRREWADRRCDRRAVGPPRSPGVGARRAGRFAHPGGVRGVPGEHRELHRHGQDAGRPGRAAAGQRRLRPGRLLRPAGDDRGGAGRVLQPGAQLITEAGGCTALVLNEGVTRARDSPSDLGMAACSSPGPPCFDEFKHGAEATTRHGKLVDLRLPVEGNHVYLLRVHHRRRRGPEHGHDRDPGGLPLHRREQPGAAAVLVRRSQHVRRQESDAHSFLSVRGKKVSAEVIVPGESSRRAAHDPERMADYWQHVGAGRRAERTIGVQGHYANGLAALYMACGQDAACVAESAVGVTRFEVRGRGGLYAAVTLPNIIVGTVGGGTRCRVSERASTSWAWPGRARRGRSPKWLPGCAGRRAVDHRRAVVRPFARAHQTAGPRPVAPPPRR